MTIVHLIVKTKTWNGSVSIQCISKLSKVHIAKSTIQVKLIVNKVCVQCGFLNSVHLVEKWLVWKEIVPQTSSGNINEPGQPNLLQLSWEILNILKACIFINIVGQKYRKHNRESEWDIW